MFPLLRWHLLSSCCRWHLTHLHADPVAIQLRLTHHSLPASSLRSIIHLTPVSPFSYLLHFHLTLSPVLSFPSFHFHPSHQIIYLHLRWQKVQPLISAHFVPLSLRLIYILWAPQHFTSAPITDIIAYSSALCLFYIDSHPGSRTVSPAVFCKDSSGSTQTIHMCLNTIHRTVRYLWLFTGKAVDKSAEMFNTRKCSRLTQGHKCSL